MVRKAMSFFGLMLLGLLAQAAVGAEKLPPATRWVPRDAVLVVEVARPNAILDAALDPKLLGRVTKTPAYKKAAAQPNFQQGLAMVRVLEGQLGTDWKSALHGLFGGGIAWAVEPSGGTLLVVDAQDEKLLARLHDVLMTFTKADAAGKGDPDRVKSQEYGGVTCWSIGNEEAHAILGHRLILTNRSSMLKKVLDLRAAADDQGLAGLPAYQAARQAAGPEAAASVFLNLAAIKKAPGVEKALAEQQGNPMGALLFAGLLEAVRQSNWLAIGLKIDGTTLALEMASDGKVSSASGAAAFTAPNQPGDGAMPRLSVPRMIASMSLYRDLHGFYAAKDKLFPERTSGLIFFENMMAIFFSGRDLTEEVLAQAKPYIRLVVAEQKYDPAIGTPQVQLPAFAAVFRVRDPKEFGDVMEEAWQKAVGLVSVTSGQKAQGGLIIKHPTYNGVPFTMASFSSAGLDKTKLGMQFNFRPALVSLGDYMVLSSTDGLAKDLIDSLKKEIDQQVKAIAGAHSLLQVDLGQVASVLGANRSAKVRQNMLEKGTRQEEAEGQIDVLLTILKYMGRAELSVADREGQARARLQVKLNPE
jgi:hypothetical protein